MEQNYAPSYLFSLFVLLFSPGRLLLLGDPGVVPKRAGPTHKNSKALRTPAWFNRFFSPWSSQMEINIPLYWVGFSICEDLFFSVQWSHQPLHHRRRMKSFSTLLYSYGCLFDRRSTSRQRQPFCKFCSFLCRFESCQVSPSR